MEELQGSVSAMGAQEGSVGMSLLQNDFAQMVRVRDAAALCAICQPDKNLAVWQRAIPSDVTQWLDQQATSRLPDDRILLDGSVGESALLERLVYSHKLQKCRQARWLISDIQHLVAVFRELSSYTQVSLRLDTIRNEGCRKFHTDKVGLRLLCTYRGNGTQWLPEVAVNRQALGVLDNDAICLDADKIQQLGCGDVGIFKGDAFGHGHMAGIVHRSAPGATPRYSRLLLCLDRG
jgi:hypothetical protein